MKTFINLKLTLGLLLTLNLQSTFIQKLSFNLNAQDPQLFEHTWYLTKVTIDDIDYIPSDYGFFPTVQFSELSGIYELSLADPLNVMCSTEIDNFQMNPNRFTIIQENWVCLPDQTCVNAPNPDDPCTIIYGNHAQIYYATNSPLIYAIEENIDETFTLEINNDEGNKALYHSEFLSTASINFTELTIYPNPSNDFLKLNKAFNGRIKVSFFDFEGKLCLNVVLEATQSQIDVKMLSSGIYFAVFKNETGERVSKKFLKN